MPLLGNDYAPPSNAPTGLSLPGFGTPFQQPQAREPTLGELVGGGLSTISQIPGFVVRNTGPALVGRNLQGPTSSAEALGRLGLDYNSPTQRAVGHGLGAGLDFMADPMMLGGLGTANRSARAAAGAASAAEEASLMRHLERLAVPGVNDMSRTARAAEAARITPYNPSPTPGARITPLTEPALPTDPAMLRQMGFTTPGTPPARPMVQGPSPASGPLLPPSNPSPSPGWLQGTPGPRGFPDFPTPLTTERFMQGSEAAANPLMDRLRRMTTQSNGPLDY